MKQVERAEGGQRHWQRDEKMNAGRYRERAADAWGERAGRQTEGGCVER